LHRLHWRIGGWSRSVSHCPQGWSALTDTARCSVVSFPWRGFAYKTVALIFRWNCYGTGNHYERPVRRPVRGQTGSCTGRVGFKDPAGEEKLQYC
jgi:hypothetical protein